MAASLDPFFVERNEATTQMEEAKITKAAAGQILDCGMWDTLVFGAYAREHGKLK